MDFVTKKQYEDALVTIQKALKGGQLVYLVQDSEKIELHKVVFTDSVDAVEINKVTFIPPEQAAKDKLFNLRKTLNKQKEGLASNQKTIEALEQEEKKLINAIALLKDQ